MENSVPQNAFEGFLNPDEYGYSRFPHDWIDVFKVVDNLAEIKILFYVARHTWGFQEVDQWKKITTNEFMHGRGGLDQGTGLSKQSVLAGIEKAMKHGYLLCKTNDRDRARVKKYYKLKVRKVDD